MNYTKTAPMGLFLCLCLAPGFIVLYTIYMIIGGFFIFVLGLIFGSFLNAWEFRIEREMTLSGRSICPKCKKKIAWYDNIPLLSWILLRGKCRQCHKPISIQYPLVELITGLTFLGLWLFSPSGIALQQHFFSITNFQYTNYQLPIRELIQYLLLTAYFLLLLLVGLHDAKTKYVLTRYVYIAVVLGLAFYLLSLSYIPTLNEAYPHLLSVGAPAGVFWLMAKLSKERLMGAGDADIALAVGALLGWPKVIPAYYLAFIAGAVYGVSVLIRKKGNLKSEVPLGPFLIAGAFFGFLFGEQIFAWYVGTVFGI